MTGLALEVVAELIVLIHISDSSTCIVHGTQPVIVPEPDLYSRVVSGLIEDMVPMPSDAFASEQGRKAHVFRHLVLRNHLITEILVLADNELSNLRRSQ